MKIIKVLLPLLLVGCTGGEYRTEYDIHIDPNFGIKMPYVMDAIDKWHEAVGVELNPIIENIKNCDVVGNVCMTIASKDKLDSIVGNDDADWTGYTIGNSQGYGIIYILDRLINIDSNVAEEQENIRDLEITLPHELGHSFNLAHDPHEGAVMCKDTACAGPNITCWDKKQYFNLRDIEYSCDNK